MSLFREGVHLAPMNEPGPAVVWTPAGVRRHERRGQESATDIERRRPSSYAPGAIPFPQERVMGSRWKKTSQFVATDPAGRKHTVYVFTQFVDMTNTEDGASETPNLV